jgi:hypothetical protein
VLPLVSSRSVLSTKYIDITVTATGPTGPINPTGDVVKFAFMLIPYGGVSSDPGISDWHTGSWITPAAGEYIAQILVGPANGGVVLAGVGTYTVWVQIADSPEVPVDPVGLLQLT